MNNSRNNILKTLAYFNIFQYPLTREELFHFHGEQTDRSVLSESLQSLLTDKKVFKLDEFYSLQNSIALAERRRTGNNNAAAEMKNALKAAKILSRFPYVKGLAISGSLSKNYADEHTDVDFFIITSANRLWIARTLMHLFYKLAYFSGKQRWFCMNYYIDEAGLEISEKNIFTAMEIVTLIPMQGMHTFNDFISSNQWTKTYFPLASFSASNAPEIRKGLFRTLTEKIFNTGFGNRVDNWLMKITNRRWQKKSLKNKKNRRGGLLGMLADKHYSKPDPKNFQQKVLDKYNAGVNHLLYAQEEQLIRLT